LRFLRVEVIGSAPVTPSTGREYSPRRYKSALEKRIFI
jgi:hypothetical protein